DRRLNRSRAWHRTLVYLRPGPLARLTVSHSSTRGTIRLGYRTGYRPASHRSHLSNSRRPRKKAATRLIAGKEHAVTRGGVMSAATSHVLQRFPLPSRDRTSAGDRGTEN